MNDMKLKRQIASIELPENINWKKFECRSIKPFISEINKSNNQTEDIQFIDWLIDEMKWFNGGKSNCYEKVKLCIIGWLYYMSYQQLYCYNKPEEIITNIQYDFRK